MIPLGFGATGQIMSDSKNPDWKIAMKKELCVILRIQVSVEIDQNAQKKTT
jgi:hypothetical protein